jgi:ubiquitin conjugation factor E4 B
VDCSLLFLLCCAVLCCAGLGWAGLLGCSVHLIHSSPLLIMNWLKGKLYGSNTDEHNNDNNDTNNSISSNVQVNSSSSSALSAAEIRQQRTAKLERNLLSAAAAAAAATNNSTEKKSEAVSSNKASPSLQAAVSSAPLIPLAKLSNKSSLPAASNSSPIKFSISSLYKDIPTNYILNSSNSSSAAYDDQLYSELLGITVDRAKSGASKIYLANLDEEGIQLFNRDLLDSIFIERLQLPMSGVTAVNYLIQIYKKCMELRQAFNQLKNSINQSNIPDHYFPRDATEFEYVLESLLLVQQRSVTYVGLCLSEGIEMSSPQREENCNEFIRLLQADPDLSRTLPAGLLEQLAENFNAELDEIFNPLISRLSTVPQNNQLNIEESRRKLIGLTQLSKVPAVALLIVNHKDFIPKASNGRQLQNLALLGGALSHGAQVNDPVFSVQATQVELEAIIQTQRRLYSSNIELIFQFLRNLISSGKKVGSARVLQLFTAIIKLNSNRRKMQFDPFTVSSDHFMLNVLCVILKFSLGFVNKYSRAHRASTDSKGAEDAVDRGYSKLDLQYLYNTNKNYIDYDSTTRLFATQADINHKRTELRTNNNTAANHDSGQEYGVNTQFFFLTLEAIHLTLPTVIKLYEQSLTAFKQLEMSAELSSPLIAAERKQLIAQILAIRTHLLDPVLLNELIVFYDYTAAWLVYALRADFNQDLTNEINKKQTSTNSNPYAPYSSARGGLLSSAIPEYLLSDFIDLLMFEARFAAHELDEIRPQHLAGFCSLFITLGSKEFLLKNPHLRSQLPDLLLLFTPDESRNQHRLGSAIFLENDELREKLVFTLINLYYMVEYGERASYYKVHARLLITLLFDYLWSIPHYRTQFSAISINNRELFFLFINMAVNDLISILDDGFNYLTAIHDLEQRYKNEAMPEDRAKEYSEAQRFASGCIKLSRCTIHMLCYLTQDITQPFVSEEFVERIATMLCYYVAKLAGDQTKKLKVNNPQHYNFEPKAMLRDIVGIILHLANSQTFIEKLAGDKRSYSHATFIRAKNLINKYSLLDSEREYKQLNSLVESLHLTAQSFVSLEDQLGEIPEEYLDEITGGILLDPVQLPITNSKVNRQTILQHLMNNQTNPFNRANLTVDMLIELPELKQEIAAFIQRRKEEFWKKKSEEEVEEESSAD